MIAQLTGVVARMTGTVLVIDVHGVGYRVNVPVTVIERLPKEGGPITLVIHTQVREDDISLFGFFEDMDLRVFELLLSVSGVGPKVALGLLSALTADDLANAISTEDVRTLTRVPGIGPKAAQLMVLKLKDKFIALGFERRTENLLTPPKPPEKKDPVKAITDDVSSALENLGYTNKADVKKAVDAAVQATDLDAIPVTDRFNLVFRQALNRLTR